MHHPQTNSSSLEKGSSLLLRPRKRRAPLVQSGQPWHFSHKHFFDQFCELLEHHFLQRPGVGLGVGAGVGVTAHMGHPVHLFQLHFLDQGFGLVEHHGLQSPFVGLGVGAGVGTGVGAGVGPGVGAGIGTVEPISPMAAFAKVTKPSGYVLLT